MKKTVCGVMLVLILISTLTLTFKIQPAKGEWTGTVYIRADGSIDPQDAPLQKIGNIYTLVGNITSSADAIVIEKDNITLDGAGFALCGNRAYESSGVNLARRTNVTIKNILIDGFYYGIYLFISYNNTISENSIINNDYGIYLACSDYNSISGNIFINSGLFVDYSFDNLVNNNLVNNKPLVYLEGISNFNVKDAGQVILVECAHILVEGLDLSYTCVGVQLLKTNNSNIIGNSVMDDQYGIYLEYSFNNVISTNNILCALSGVHLQASYYNNVLANNIKAKVKDYSMYGIALWGGSNYNTIQKNNITDCSSGIRIWFSSGNIISGNNATENFQGICIDSGSHENNIFGNDVLANYFGIYLWQCMNNTIHGNNVRKNHDGVLIGYSRENEFSHNNFIDNSQQVYVYSSDFNVWDDGYPSGGNFWSDYTGLDANGDALGDTHYTMDANNTDRYPLIAPFRTFDAGVWNGISYNVDIVSNSSVSGFQFNVDQKSICFNVTGDNGTVGFCRVTIPNDLLWVDDGWTITVGDQSITDYTLISDENFTYLYFTYNQSTQTVTIQGTHILPEYPLIALLILLLTMSTLTAIMNNKTRKTKDAS
ncbi:MAG: NosD domain-containing protein [Candidatus Bathyarchaeia archaeon]